MMRVFVCRAPYLDVAGLLHEPSGIFGSSVAFRELHSEELESPFKVCLQKVLFRCLEQDMRRWEERGMWWWVDRETKESIRRQTFRE